MYSGQLVVPVLVVERQIVEHLDVISQRHRTASHHCSFVALQSRNAI